MGSDNPKKSGSGWPRSQRTKVGAHEWRAPSEDDHHGRWPSGSPVGEGLSADAASG